MSNRAVLGVVVIVMLLSPFSKPVRGERTICLEPGEDARRRQAVLFPFDARSMSYRHGLELSLVQGSKQGVVIRPGPAGSPDSARVDYYGAVVHRDGKFQMWYRG
ncbi:MAG TPA: hypothetical protein VNL70_04795, partial [Tepidisphaeraceae bacterium]|nr:hypothetical protein [Tepidisphaeraceae bacterium]